MAYVVVYRESTSNAGFTVPFRNLLADTTGYKTHLKHHPHRAQGLTIVPRFPGRASFAIMLYTRRSQFRFYFQLTVDRAYYAFRVHKNTGFVFFFKPYVVERCSEVVWPGLYAAQDDIILRTARNMLLEGYTPDRVRDMLAFVSCTSVTVSL
ncbi:hypothetical protein R3P38DRAFT_3185908 [Favolaschia claudopus]|uniref:Uncharacterized protein n=1 Tax=Favolaschia claudopus TaxID=2862362 RepID=A0AAW0C6T6_9AGAR